MTNDGNAAARGEYAARPDCDTGLLLIAPGTGLGGGLVLPGGQIYEGQMVSRWKWGLLRFHFGGGWRIASLLVWFEGMYGGLGVAYGIATQAWD